MTEYEQLEYLFLSLGVAFRQDTNDGDEDIPPCAQRSISVGMTTFWFTTAGQFLGVDHVNFNDGWEPRGGTLSAPTVSQLEQVMAIDRAMQEAQANIQSLGYPTWAKADFIRPSSQEP